MQPIGERRLVYGEKRLVVTFLSRERTTWREWYFAVDAAERFFVENAEAHPRGFGFQFFVVREEGELGRGWVEARPPQAVSSA